MTCEILQIPQTDCSTGLDCSGTAIKTNKSEVKGNVTSSGMTCKLFSLKTSQLIL